MVSKSNERLHSKYGRKGACNHHGFDMCLQTTLHKMCNILSACLIVAQSTHSHAPSSQLDLLITWQTFQQHHYQLSP